MLLFDRDDVCNCGENQECSCEVLADYARACSRSGATISWRNASNCRKYRLVEIGSQTKLIVNLEREYWYWFKTLAIR